MRETSDKALASTGRETAQSPFPLYAATGLFALPHAAAPTLWDLDRAAAVVAPHVKTRGGLLPALHALQGAFGYIDDAAIPLLAEAFNVSRADVFGVVTFYHDFRRQPPSGRVVKICRADACRAAGGEALAAHAGATAPAGVAVEAVYCLGLCALGPSVMIDGRPYARMTNEHFDALVKGGAP